MQTFPAKERYGIIRFIAFEYAAKYGPYALMRLYMDKNNIPIMVSSNKVSLDIPNTKKALLPAKLLILHCLYNEFPTKEHLGMLLQVTRLLERKSEIAYAERIGIDISSYRLIESQIIENKGLINKVNGIRKFHINPDYILNKLNIDYKELDFTIEAYYE